MARVKHWELGQSPPQTGQQHWIRGKHNLLTLPRAVRDERDQVCMCVHAPQSLMRLEMRWGLQKGSLQGKQGAPVQGTQVNSSEPQFLTDPLSVSMVE